VKSEWKHTESRQRAKYYKLTASGRKQLVSEEARWGQLVEAIVRVMNPAGVRCGIRESGS
jgi:DNA-binding PadR family transcriptional regulator